MTFDLEFTDRKPAYPVVLGCAGYDDTLDAELPPLAVEAIRRQSQAPVVDILVEQEGGFQRILFTRLGSKVSSSQRLREEAGAALIKQAGSGLEATLLVDLRRLGDEGLDLLMGMLLACWKFDRYRTTLKPHEKCSLEKIVVLCNDPKGMEGKFARRKAVAEGVHYARELTSEPPNVFFPTAYAEKLQELKALGIGVEVFHEDALKDLGMNSLLAVGSGSCRPSCVVVLEWKGSGKNAAPVAVVGKGVCFDSGGLCIKQAIHQHDMKWDKAGAGIVAGLMKALALSQSSAHVVGVIGLVENMPDGKAMKPGDVVRTMSGQTIEIVHTDAEGRLVLADCLWYAQQRFRPRAVVDLGTLTQETFGALGCAFAGLFSNEKSLTEQLKCAGETTGDHIWELPMGSYFAKQIESDVADMKNLGVEGMGECGAAAEFLRRFVTCDVWGHLDIAGVSWSKEDLPLSPKGVTGFGVRLLEEWIHELK